MKITKRQLREIISSYALGEHWVVDPNDSRERVHHDWNLMGRITRRDTKEDMHRHYSDEETAKTKREKEKQELERAERKAAERWEKMGKQVEREKKEKAARKEAERRKKEKAKKERWWNRLDWGITGVQFFSEFIPGPGTALSAALVVPQVKLAIRNENWLGAGLSMISLFPVVGDAVSIFGKTVASGGTIGRKATEKLASGLWAVSDDKIQGWVTDFLGKDTKTGKKISNAVKRFAKDIKEDVLGESKSMKITRMKLRRIISEEISRVILEQTAEPVKASDDAKKAAEEAENAIQVSNATTLAKLQAYMASTPGLDHTELSQATKQLQQAQSDIQSAIDSVTAEADKGGKYGFILDEDEDEPRESHRELDEIIKKQDCKGSKGSGKWVLRTHDDTRTLGCHKTKAGADRQERAIQTKKSSEE